MTAPAGSTNTSVQPKITGSGTSEFANQSGFSSGSTPAAFLYQPKTVDTTYLTQTSQPDVTSMVNSAMQNLLGRFATPAEIAMYGKELLAAERANTGQMHSELKYDPNTAKPLTQTGQMTTTGVDPMAFIQNLIQGTGEAKQYRVAGTYMQALSTMADKYKGSFNG